MTGKEEGGETRYRRLPREALVSTGHTRDGIPVLFRPLWPEDALAWRTMIEVCTPETLWLRFERRSRDRLLAEADRYCTVDPTCEVVLVAELLAGEPGRFVGEARLCRVLSGDEAEFSVLVADPWQGKGLGSALTDRCLELARAWKVRRVLTELVPENVRMIALLQSRGFRFSCDSLGRIVRGEKVAC
jgi:acetyltransferase